MGRSVDFTASAGAELRRKHLGAALALPVAFSARFTVERRRCLDRRQLAAVSFLHANCGRCAQPEFELGPDSTVRLARRRLVERGDGRVAGGNELGGAASGGKTGVSAR